MKYRPLDMFIKQTDELKELITKYPDYPIVVIVANEVVADDDYNWWYAPCLSFSVGEILDCEQEVDDMKVFSDRDDFEEALIDKLSWDEDYEKLSDVDFNILLQEKLKQYEPYWRKVIQIRADV